MKIGITGMIGSGKSTAAQYFKKHGFEIVDADFIGKEVVESNPVLLKKLAKTFGFDILTPSKKLRRKVLGSKAFADELSRKKLNELVHPYLLKELHRQIKRHEKANRDIVVDAALLLDWKLEKHFDMTILIHSSKEVRIKRALQRGFNIVDIKNIQKRQMTYSQYRNRVDMVFYNNKSQRHLFTKIEKLLKKLQVI